jgi:predicted transcriptional regulator
MKSLLIVALSAFALYTAQVGLEAQSKGSAKAMSAMGTVKSVSGTSLVVTGKDAKDMTFAIDGSTKFVGKGLSTKSAKGPMIATDAVHDGDQVSVSYHDMGGTMHAAQVRITAKGAASTMKKQ